MQRAVELAAELELRRDLAHVAAVLAADERHADAGGAGAAGAADAVRVGVGVDGRVELEDTWLMSSTSMPRAATSVATSVVDLAGGEGGERASALTLRLVAVHGDGLHALLERGA